MAKAHKYYRSRLEMDTSLSVDRVMDLARQTVEAQSHLKLTTTTDDTLIATIASWAGVKLLQFRVTARPAAGGTRVDTAILDYRTSQMTYFFIPVGPKSMEGYGLYRDYMRALEQVVVAADPAARAVITERDAA
jgi:hypothetical protein